MNLCKPCINIFSRATELLGCSVGLRASCVATSDCNADLIRAINEDESENNVETCLTLANMDESIDTETSTVARSYALLPAAAPPSADVVASLAGVGVRRLNDTVGFPQTRPAGASRLFYGLVNFLELKASWPSELVDVEGALIGIVKARKRALKNSKYVGFISFISFSYKYFFFFSQGSYCGIELGRRNVFPHLRRLLADRSERDQSRR
jgi:hypothetical protein